MKQLAFLVISSFLFVKNIAQIPSHFFWLNKLIFIVFLNYVFNFNMTHGQGFGMSTM